MSAIESRARVVIAAIVLILGCVLSGCANITPRDPLEPFNRGVFAFNDAIDSVVLRPVASGYVAVLPQIVRTGVSNFFSNIDDVTVAINNLLQLKIPQAVSDAGRFLINTTVGLLGVIDAATHLGLEKHNEDFGQTLGFWGIGDGPYLVLPFLGPSSVRDGIGRWADMYTDLVMRVNHIPTRNQLLGTRAIHHRAQLLDSEKVLDAAAIDRYAFLRDAFLQRRRSLVHDGNPPPEPEEPEPADKPRTEAPASPGAILVDQFGNVVAAPAELVGQRMQPATANHNSEPVSGKAFVPVPAAPGSDLSSSTPPAPASSGGVARVMRVWLPGGAP